MDWWAGVNSCVGVAGVGVSTTGAANGATAAAAAAQSLAGQSVADMSQIEAGIFDSWINCEDLDLDTILHQANNATLSSSASSSSSSPNQQASLFLSSQQQHQHQQLHHQHHQLHHQHHQHHHLHHHQATQLQQQQLAEAADQAQHYGSFCNSQYNVQQQPTAESCATPLKEEQASPGPEVDSKQNIFNFISSSSHQVYTSQQHDNNNNDNNNINDNNNNDNNNQLQQHDHQQLQNNQAPQTPISSTQCSSASSSTGSSLSSLECSPLESSPLASLHLQQQLQHQSSNIQMRSLTANKSKNSNQNAAANNKSGAPKVRRCRHITDYVLAEEEKRLLIKEGYADFPMTCQARPLSKSEERILRKIRRKIRNKKSAQCSRQRKKEYVEDLEKRYASVVRENDELKKTLNLLQRQHQHQQQHIQMDELRQDCCVKLQSTQYQE